MEKLSAFLILTVGFLA